MIPATSPWCLGKRGALACLSRSISRFLDLTEKGDSVLNGPCPLLVGGTKAGFGFRYDSEVTTHEGLVAAAVVAKVTRNIIDTQILFFIAWEVACAIVLDCLASLDLSVRSILNDFHLVLIQMHPRVIIKMIICRSIK